MNIIHSQYNRLVDDIFLLGANAMLKMNVSLYHNTENYGRLPYHREYMYYDERAQQNLVSLKRSYDFYLSIENIKDTDLYKKEFIRIGVSEIMFIRIQLQQAMEWFTDSKYKGLYLEQNGKLVLARKVDPVLIEGLPMSKHIRIEPTVIQFNELMYTGVRMYLSSDVNFVELGINKFAGFVQMMNDVNLIMMAQNMLNYLGRPSNGYNMYDPRSNTMFNVSPKEQVTGGLNNRKIVPLSERNNLLK